MTPMKSSRSGSNRRRATYLVTVRPSTARLLKRLRAAAGDGATMDSVIRALADAKIAQDTADSAADAPDSALEQAPQTK